MPSRVSRAMVLSCVLAAGTTIDSGAAQSRGILSRLARLSIGSTNALKHGLFTAAVTRGGSPWVQRLGSQMPNTVGWY